MPTNIKPNKSIKSKHKKRQVYTDSLLWGGVPVIVLYFADMHGWMPNAQLPSFPVNLYIGMGLVNVLLFGWIFYKQTSFIKWLVSVPASISAITWFSLLVLLMGFIPQGNDPNGAVHQRLVSSAPMAYAALFLLVTLGTVTAKRSIPFKRSNIGFILNHFGLWLTLTAALLGSSDLKRLQISLQEGRTGQAAFDAQNQGYTLPFALHLHDFQMETAPPKILLANPQESRFIQPESTFYQEAHKGAAFEMEGWSFQVLTFLENAIPQEGGWVAAEQVGAAPAVQVSANGPNGQERTGWIFAGSFRYDPAYLELSKTRWLTVLPGDADRFRSELTVLQAGGKETPLSVEVNKPINFEGWMIYQSGYREEWGKWSDYSVLELVRDPWLPVVFTGIFLMLFGAVYLMVQGKKAEQAEAG